LTAELARVGVMEWIEPISEHYGALITTRNRTAAVVLHGDAELDVTAGHGLCILQDLVGRDRLRHPPRARGIVVEQHHVGAGNEPIPWRRRDDLGEARKRRDRGERRRGGVRGGVEPELVPSCGRRRSPCWLTGVALAEIPCGDDVEGV